MPDYRKLDSDAWDVAKAQAIMVAEAERELVKRRAQLSRFIAQVTGVDIEAEDWTLDLEHGLLERISKDGNESDHVCSEGDSDARLQGRRGHRAHAAKQRVSRAVHSGPDQSGDND